MPLNARQKGAQGEREAAAFLSLWGYSARRGQQFSGAPDSPDVVTDLPFHVEVKRVEASSPLKWLHKATSDSGGLKPPLVLWRPNRSPWVAMFWANNILDHITSMKPDLEPDKDPGKYSLYVSKGRHRIVKMEAASRGITLADMTELALKQSPSLAAYNHD